MSTAFRIRFTVVAGVLAGLQVGSAWACEPVVPLVMLFSGQLIAASSMLVLVCVVVAKAVAFAMVQRRINPVLAFVFMVLANVLSTVIGIGLVIMPAIPAFFIIPLAMVYAVSVLPARRLVQLYSSKPRGSLCSQAVAIGVTVLYVLTLVLFGLAQYMLDTASGSVMYWTLKLLYIYAGLAVSILLTTFWEEWAVAKLAEGWVGNVSFVPAVVKANLVAFLMAGGYAAMHMLPERLRSPGFLVQVIEQYFRS